MLILLSSSTSSKSPIESYLESIAFITLLVNLYGLAVEAITVLVVSPVSFLYLSYTVAATDVCVSITYPQSSYIFLIVAASSASVA